jgi:hypothetical protein
MSIRILFATQSKSKAGDAEYKKIENRNDKEKRKNLLVCEEAQLKYSKSLRKIAYVLKFA